MAARHRRRRLRRRAVHQSSAARAARSSQSSSSLWRTGLRMKSSARDAGVVVQALVEGVGRDDRHRRVAQAQARAGGGSFPSRRCRAWPGPSGSRRARRPAASRSSASWPLAAVRSSKPSGSSTLHQQLAVGLLVVDHQDLAARAFVAAARARWRRRAPPPRRCIASGRNRRMRNTEPTPGVLAHRHLAAHQVGEHLGDGQAEAGAGRGVAAGRGAAREGLEDVLQLLGASCRGRCPRSRCSAISRA